MDRDGRFPGPAGCGSPSFCFLFVFLFFVFFLGGFFSSFFLLGLNLVFPLGLNQLLFKRIDWASSEEEEEAVGSFCFGP